jgi:hypothetical protein
MRVAFSIVLNGLHHLQHNNYYQTMLDNFDYWIIVEGQALPNGSTSWCKQLNETYQINGRSVDGTHEFLSELAFKNSKLIYIPSNGPWNSKDQMVNVAIKAIKNITNECFLWEVDIDEQWTKTQLEQAELELTINKTKTGHFLCDYYVGKEWLSLGGWGEGQLEPYRRLWNWKGESFIKHEPPTLDTPDQSISLLTPRFTHYAYYFEKDVAFKNDYYSGHENVLEGYHALEKSTNNEEPLSVLFPNGMKHAWSNTKLIKKNSKPTIASVMFSRNDGFKDDKRCLAHFLACLETFDEIIYIDWNSDPEKGSLLWKLEPHLPKTNKIKHIIIPPDIVNQLTPDPNAFQVNETITRNIGMRRVESDWIVNTNIDIIPPSREELVKFIEHCDKNTFYTISRREAPLEVFDKYKAEEWKEFYNELTSTIGPRYFGAKVSNNDNYSLINCCGDFQLAHRDIYYKIKGYEEQMYKFCFIDSNIQKKAKINGFGLEARFAPPLYHIEHGAYHINENGEKEEAKEWNANNRTDKYNDAYKWIETFQTSENDEHWGLGTTEIEYETI